MGRNGVSMVGGGSVGGYVSMGECEYGWSMSMVEAEVVKVWEQNKLAEHL